LKHLAIVAIFTGALVIHANQDALAQVITAAPQGNILCKPGNTLSIQNTYAITYSTQPPPSQFNIFPECCPKGQNGKFSCLNGFTLTSSSGGSPLLTTTGVLSGATATGGTITGQTATFTLPSTAPASYTLKLIGWCYMGATDPIKGLRNYTSPFQFKNSVNVSVSVNNPACS
jgi:hypothetical protein